MINNDYKSTNSSISNCPLKMNLFNYLVKLKSLNQILPIQHFRHSQFKENYFEKLLVSTVIIGF